MVTATAAYPTHALEGCESALVLFAAAFGGAQDAWFIAEAGMTATCVDTDRAKLEAMDDAYPAGWEFVEDDAFQYARRVQRQWDVVSLDPFTNLFDRCAQELPLWCALARKAVVLGSGPDTTFPPVPGWGLAEMRLRSSFNGGTYWAVFTP